MLLWLLLNKPPWPNGQGVGLLIRRLRVRVPQGVRIIRERLNIVDSRLMTPSEACAPLHAHRSENRSGLHQTKLGFCAWYLVRPRSASKGALLSNESVYGVPHGPLGVPAGTPRGGGPVFYKRSAGEAAGGPPRGGRVERSAAKATKTCF